jgi:hypothetical protein
VDFNDLPRRDLRRTHVECHRAARELSGAFVQAISHWCRSASS